MDIHRGSTLLILTVLVACNGQVDLSDLDDRGGPPISDETEVLQDDKADGSVGLGTPFVEGRFSAVRAVVGSQENCNDGNTVDFNVTYVNRSLPWGVRLNLVRAFSGQSTCFGCDPVATTHYDWIYEEVEPMASSGPWTWSTHTTESRNLVQEDSLQYFKFVVRIEMPDGSVRWDNGGSSWGYYRTQIPAPVCDPSWTPWEENPGSYVDLPASVVR